MAKQETRSIGSYGLLPPANEVWGKVIFLHLSVILFTGGGEVPGQVPPGQVHPLGRYTPRADAPPSAVHAEILSTSGQYASYWNAFLFTLAVSRTRTGTATETNGPMVLRRTFHTALEQDQEPEQGQGIKGYVPIFQALKLFQIMCFNDISMAFRSLVLAPNMATVKSFCIILVPVLVPVPVPRSQCDYTINNI